VAVFNLINGDPTVEEPCRTLDRHWLLQAMIGLTIVMDRDLVPRMGMFSDPRNLPPLPPTPLLAPRKKKASFSKTAH